jgi:hypothetical protein
MIINCAAQGPSAVKNASTSDFHFGFAISGANTPPDSKLASGCRTSRALSGQHISNELLTREFQHSRLVTLFPDRHFAPALVEEVQQKDDVVLRLSRARGLGGGHLRTLPRHASNVVPKLSRFTRVQP